MRDIGYILINIIDDYRTLSYSDNIKPSDICIRIKTNGEYYIDDVFKFLKDKCERFMEEDNLYNKIIEKIIEYETFDLKKIGIFTQYIKGYKSDVDFSLGHASIF